jgi:general secretion pathway protein C
MAMLDKVGKAALHGAGLAVVCALAAYWAVKIITPPPTVAPPPLAAAPVREPDPVFTARLFGLVQAPQQAAAASNIQVMGVFAAGKHSSAVLVVDGRPARAYRVGQEIVPGTRLAEVQRDVVFVESGGARQEVRMPVRPAPAPLIGDAAPAPVYALQGNVLGAAGGSSRAAPAGAAPTAAPSRPLLPNLTAPRLDPPAAAAVPQQQGGSPPPPPPVQQESPRQP